MDAKTRVILSYFEEINRIPRCSKQEQKIAAWLLSWARQRGFESRQDAAGNLVLQVPAKGGRKDAPIVIIQGHMDMVCEKRPDVIHDFSQDPIRHVLDGEWLRADGTSLGADNGIALAMAMALATDPEVAHPPLELLFTVDEESGLTGADKLQPSFFEGRILINIDSEDEGVLTVGCAGGRHTELSLDLAFNPMPANVTLLRVTAAGLRGGHSGIDINAGRANAIRLLARVICAAGKEFEVALVSLHGGTTHNAIPRDASAVIALAPEKSTPFFATAADLQSVMRLEFGAVEPDLSIRVEPLADVDADWQVVSPDDTRRFLNLLLALPDGVDRMSMQAPGKVETSSNLAKVNLASGRAAILTSQRSARNSRLDEMTGRVEALASLVDARAKSDKGYPSWEPDLSSDLLSRCQNAYQRLFGRKPEIEIIHAGLECAVIGAKVPGMQMVSMGPTIKNPHSPDERLFLPSVQKVWIFLVELLKSYSNA
jgi:dipeptidase D